jgi:uncharacterized protein with PIN domain
MDANRALKDRERRILDRRQHLLNRYALALRMQDQERVRDSLDAIRRFNRKKSHRADYPGSRFN